jgi:hypothetical protein
MSASGSTTAHLKLSELIVAHIKIDMKNVGLAPQATLLPFAICGNILHTAKSLIHPTVIATVRAMALA